MQDATLCFGGAASGTVYCWLASTGSLLRSWPAHFREVTQLLCSDGFLLTASADAAVQVYNLADLFAEPGAPRAMHGLQGHSLGVTALAVLGHGLKQTVATAGRWQAVKRSCELSVGHVGASFMTMWFPSHVESTRCCWNCWPYIEI